MIAMFKMNEEQQILFDKLSTLQSEVALNSLSGMNDIDAYKNSSGKAKKERAMRSSAGQILSKLVVIEFLASMRVEAVNDAIMSREEMLESLTVIARLCDDKMGAQTLASLTDMKGGMDVKMTAMKRVAELQGYDAPIKVEATEELTPWSSMTFGDQGDE